VSASRNVVSVESYFLPMGLGIYAVQNILAQQRIIERQETLEDEILSYLFKNLHHFRPELVSFKTWLSRVTLNLVLEYQKQKEGINHNERSRIQITIQGE
jgi:hypothetical protein